MTPTDLETSRRRLVLAGAGVGLGVLLVGCSRGEGELRLDGACSEGEEPEGEGAEAVEIPVGPTEDLMREHGVVARLLLLYEAAGPQLAAGDPSPLPVIVEASHLMRTFVEDYHERLEEKNVFPRLEREGVLVGLVATLRLQHELGRQLTDQIHTAALRGAFEVAPGRPLPDAMAEYVRVMRVHVAREDTVVFPAFRGVVDPASFHELGEMFEQEEEQLFGADGFQTIVRRVGQLEQALGIHELASYV